MKNEIRKFLEFNGKTIFFLDVEGTNWIAVKPICEALGIDYIQQYKNLKNDIFLSGVLCTHTMHDSSNRLQKMTCLPEFFIYGWIFSINSKNQELQQYKWECYRIIYNHFHGSVTRREKILLEKTKTEVEIEKLQAALNDNPEYKRLQELKSNVNQTKKQLNSLDKEVTASQLALFN
jgi:hypothetical protein